MSTRRSTAELASRLPESVWAERLAAADRESALLEQVLSRVRDGSSRSEALRQVFPEKLVSSMLKRLCRYEAGGRDGLLNRQLPVRGVRKVDEEARGVLRVLALSHPEAGSVWLAQEVSKVLGRSVRATSIQRALLVLGLARPKGRPRKREGSTDTPRVFAEAEVAVVTPLPLAGCELLKAVDEDIGATAALTRGLDAFLDALAELEGPVLVDSSTPDEHSQLLPELLKAVDEDIGATAAPTREREARLDALAEPEGPVVVDASTRDECGRFLPEYNRPQPRTEPELGERFDSVERRRQGKQLGAMRVVGESEETHLRKNRALVYLPAIVRGPRWSALGHWRGDLLGELVGYPYQASTLDKYLRSLKYAGVAKSAREAVSTFWLAQEGSAREERTGAVLLYVDAKTKPLWTRQWTKATRVSENGRVMPAVTTVSLHSGAGTPLLYRSYSGHVSIPEEVGDFLDLYQQHAGPATARRVVVIDREAHAVWLFKALDARGHQFIIPLRSSVVGPKARFEDRGDWSPYQDGPDEVCEAKLWLHDRRKGERPLRLRVVGRRRHRTGRVAWYATNAPAEEFSANDIIRLYFDRWPAQEHVYREGSGMVGLDVHHGYGKRKVTDVAVLDQLDRLEGSRQRLLSAKESAEVALDENRRALTVWEEVRAELQSSATTLRVEVESGFRSGRDRAELEGMFERYSRLEQWSAGVYSRCMQHRRAAEAAEATLRDNAQRSTRLAEDRARLEKRREIFTVDVELDEVMTAFKLTFMNLCGVLMRQYLGTWLELETLIDAVLTLPGERVVTATTETVRIYRPLRDARTLAAVEKACAALTALGLRRNKRTARFELVDSPDRRKPRPVIDPVEARINR
jgi:hypothetical protein